MEGKGTNKGKLGLGWSMTGKQIQILSLPSSLLSSCFSLYFLSLQQYKRRTLQQGFKSWLAVQGGERERNGDQELCKLEDDGPHEREKGEATVLAAIGARGRGRGGG